MQSALVHIVEFRELAGLHRAFRGRELADDDLEQRGFAEPISPADADALAVLEREVESGKQSAPAEFHAEIAHLHGAIAELRRRRNAKFHVLLNDGPVLRRFVVVTLETVLLLAALRARALAHPRQFLFQKHLALVLDHRVGFLPLGFVEQVIGVVAVVRPEFSIAQFDHARHDAVEKIAVVRDDEKRAAELFQKLRNPLDGFRVEMVRRLVENQKVRPRNNGPAHRHAPLLAAGKRLDVADRRPGNSDATSLFRCADPASSLRALGCDAPVPRAASSREAAIQIPRSDRERVFAPARTFPRTSNAGSSMKSCGR